MLPCLNRRKRNFESMFHHKYFLNPYFLCKVGIWPIGDLLKGVELGKPSRKKISFCLDVFQILLLSTSDPQDGTIGFLEVHFNKQELDIVKTSLCQHTNMSNLIVFLHLVCTAGAYCQQVSRVIGCLLSSDVYRR